MGECGKRLKGLVDCRGHKDGDRGSLPSPTAITQKAEMTTAKQTALPLALNR